MFKPKTIYFSNKILLTIKILTAVFIVPSCGGKKSDYSFKIKIVNNSDMLLSYSMGVGNSDARGCDGPLYTEYLIKSSETKEHFYKLRCSEEPHYNSVSVGWPDGYRGNSIGIGWHFLEDEFHIQCDNERCVNILGDFADNESSVKPFQVPVRYQVSLTNNSDNILNISLGAQIDELNPCDEPFDDHSIKPKIKEELRYRTTCKAVPGYHLLNIEKEDGSSINFKFISKEIQIACDNEKCEGSLEDLIASENPVKSW